MLVPDGWPMISGWWKTDNDNTQPESFSVSSPPRPDSLPVSAAIWLLNSVPVSVTVKVTQSESGIRAAPKKTSGLPKSVRPCARRSHSAQDRPLGRGLGASVIDPVEKSAPLRPFGPEHEILRPDCNRGGRSVPFVLEPVDRYAVGRRRQADVP